MLRDVEAFSLASLDHVVPHSAGGSSGPENVVACCLPCNQIKAWAFCATIEEGRQAIQRNRNEQGVKKLAVARAKVNEFTEVDGAIDLVAPIV